MQDDYLALLQASFAIVFDRKKDIANRFYENLFHSENETRALFSNNIERQKEMFASMLVEIVSCAETPEIFAAKVEALAEHHKRYNIPAAHFEVAGKALLDAFADELDALLSSTELRAWNRAARTMTDAMAAASAA
ncbi:MAG: globin domain-containing protein [Paracoccaceae bacterium]